MKENTVTAPRAARCNRTKGDKKQKVAFFIFPPIKKQNDF
jgi:hypothetical protein